MDAMHFGIHQLIRQGGVGVLLELHESRTKAAQLFSRVALQNYILACCQDEKGGLRDKPEKYNSIKGIGVLITTILATVFLAFLCASLFIRIRRDLSRLCRLWIVLGVMKHTLYLSIDIAPDTSSTQYSF